MLTLVLKLIALVLLLLSLASLCVFLKLNAFYEGYGGYKWRIYRDKSMKATAVGLFLALLLLFIAINM